MGRNYSYRARYAPGTSEEQLLNRWNRELDRQLTTKKIVNKLQTKEKPMAFDMSNYVDVATRIKLLIEQYPKAQIMCSTPKVIEIAGHTFIEVTATVDTNEQENTRTAIASAWEPFPGKTTYTKDSEMMNAETSAVGRAIGMLGIGLTGSMASANEVQNRQVTTQQGDTTVTRPSNAPSEKQVWLLKKLLKEQGKLPPANLAELDKFEVSRMIEALKAGEHDEVPFPEEEPF